jgi:long-chain fatty acid transport protein
MRLQAGFLLRLKVFCIFLSCTTFSPTHLIAQNGHVLDGMGPQNQAMGGVGSGLAVEPIGALHWNPAAIGGLPADQRRRMAFGIAAFSPTTSLSSSIAANSFGPGFPATDLSGNSSSRTGTSFIPSFAMVYAPLDSDWLYGVGVYGISGFGVDYAADSSNPILTPQPPAGMGFGSIYSKYQILQVSPTVARRLNRNWTVAVAPTLNLGSLAVNPFSGAAPDDANGDGFPTYPGDRDAETSFGMGLKLGAYWQSDNGWSAGGALQSPVWFGDFKYTGKDENGAPRSYAFDLDYPALAMAGVGYTADRGWRVGADIRWIDYANTNGFDARGFAADGSVQGFHWRSIPVVAIGGELPVHQNLSLMAGYSWNASPIRAADAFFNVASPAIVQNHLSLGLRWRLESGMEFAMAYKHGFAESLSGSFEGGAGAIPGTEVRSELATDSLTLGLSWSF